MFFVLATSCRDMSDPDQLAKAFVDAYYVEYDFDRALTFSDGAAALRLHDEKKLVDDARTKVAIAQSRSRTYYGDPEKHAVGESLVHYTFALEIHHGSNEMRRTAVIMLAKKSGGWKVIGFREVNEGGAPSTGEPGSDGVRTSTSER
jgi:hypothetical protein